LCNANTYRSIHEGLFFNSSPALDLKNTPWDSPISFLFLLASVTTRRNFGWFRTFIIPRPYYDSSHWNYFRKSSMKEVLK
jgi:hypothetical protein